MPPGRPKNWRTKAFEVLECAVAQRIEGTRVDEREDNKLWLVRYLELTRQLILEDLRVVKTLCVPCFPPHYDIVNKYVNMYHTCLSSSVSLHLIFEIFLALRPTWCANSDLRRHYYLDLREMLYKISSGSCSWLAGGMTPPRTPLRIPAYCTFL